MAIRPSVHDKSIIWKQFFFFLKKSPAICNWRLQASLWSQLRQLRQPSRSNCLIPCLEKGCVIPKGSWEKYRALPKFNFGNNYWNYCRVLPLAYMICRMHTSKLKGKESYNNNKYLLENQHMMSFTCIIFFVLASSAIYQLGFKEVKLHMAELAWLIGGRTRIKIRPALI